MMLMKTNIPNTPIATLSLSSSQAVKFIHSQKGETENFKTST